MVLLDAVILLFVIGVIGLGVYAIARTPQRRELKQEKRLELKKAHSAANHQDMFIMLVNLVTTHRRGYEVVFTDPEDLAHAEKLIQTYREETTSE